MQRRRKEAGFTSLVGVLVAMAVMLVLMAALLPASLRMEQTTNEISAAQAMAQLNAAEFAFAQSYAMFPPPSGLSGTLAQNLSCSNPMLLSGPLTQNPQGYTMVWTQKAVRASATCPAVTGYAGYTVSFEPQSKLQGSRYFFSDTDDPQGTQLIHVAEGRPATDSDPTYATPASSLIVVANGGGGGGTPSCPAGSGETWNGTACVCPSGQTVVGGVCTAQKTCVTNESLLNGQCYTTFPSTQGYPLNYFYTVMGTFNNSANFPAPIIGTGTLTFQFSDPNTFAISGQMNGGTCTASGVISLNTGGVLTLSGGSCYVANNWTIPGGGILFSANGLGFSLPGGQLTSNSGFEGQSTGITLLLSGSMNPMPN